MRDVFNADLKFQFQLGAIGSLTATEVLQLYNKFQFQLGAIGSF